MRAAVGPGTDVHCMLQVAQDAAARVTAGDQPHLGIVESDGQVVCGAVTRRLFQPEAQGGGTGGNDHRLRDRSFFVGRDPTKPGPEGAAVRTAAGACATALIIAQRGAKVGGRFIPVRIRRTRLEAAVHHHIVVRPPRRDGLRWLGRCPPQAGRVPRWWGLVGDRAVLTGRWCSDKNGADQQHECGRGHNEVRDTSLVHRTAPWLDRGYVLAELARRGHEVRNGSRLAVHKFRAIKAHDRRFCQNGGRRPVVRLRASPNGTLFEPAAKYC